MGPRLRLVRKGELRPHITAVETTAAAFLRLTEDQQAAALSIMLEGAPEPVLFAAGTLTQMRPVMVLVAGHTKGGAA